MTFSRVDSFLRAESSEAMHEAIESRSIPLAWGASTRDREVFRLDRRIGEGGFGEIWRAEQTSLARVVAVKRLRHDLPPDVEQNTDDLFRQALFLREALTTARLDHPYIVPVYSLGIDEQGFDALGMKLVEGLEWADVLAEDFRVLEPDQFLLKHVSILHSVAQAVAFAHSRGILHRDIKPSQVMLGRYGEVYLTDWGLAFVWADVRESGVQQNNPTYSAPLIEYSNPAGTPAYMAPEQTTRTVEQLGPHTDVYLLGATLYQLLTGRPPHAASDSRESFEQARRGEVLPPRQRTPNRAIPAELEEICLRALAPQPGDRYSSAEHFLEALDSWRTGSRQRREATDILLAQEQRLASGTLAYADYNAVLGELERARVLAPTNSRIGDVQQAALRRYARAALDNDDLVLARSISGRLSDPDEQRRIADAVAMAEQHRNRQETQRRVALVGVAALLLVLLAGAFKYSLDQRDAADRLMDERNAAERARGLAEEARDETAAALLATDEARRQAEQARDETAIALRLAEDAREQLAAALRAVELEQYSSSMTIARTALDTGDVATARDTLFERSPAPLRHWEWGHLVARLYPEDALLTRFPVFHTQWSADGRMLVHAGRGNVRLYDGAGVEVLHHFSVANHLNWHAEVSPNGRWLATASFDSRAYVLDVQTGREVARMILGSPGRVAVFSPDSRLLAVGGRGGIMQVYATESWELLHRLRGVEKDFYNACFHPDGRRLATASLDPSARLWDAATGELLLEYTDHEEGVLAVSFTADGSQLVTASSDRFWRVFDTETARLVRAFENPDSYLHDLALSPDNSLLATADNNGVCRLWDFKTGEVLATAQSEPPLVKVAFDPAGARLVYNSYDTTRIIALERLLGHPRLTPVLSSADARGLDTLARVYGVPLSRDGAWGAREQAWNSPAGLTQVDLLGHSFGIVERYADWSPDRSMRVQYSYDAMSASVLDNATSTVLHAFPAARWYDARFSPDGRHLAMAQGNGQVEVFETATWSSVARTLPAAPAGTPAVGDLNAIAFDADGRRLALSFLTGHAFVWEIFGPAPPVAMETADTSVLCVAFRPDGAVLAGGTGGRNVVFWDAATGKTLARIPGHKSSVVGMVFSPDGRRLVSFANRADIRIWDAMELRQILLLRDLSADNAPLGIGFTSDGLQLFAVTQQRKVLFFEGFPWDPAALPGKPEDSLSERLELYKRQSRQASLPRPSSFQQ